MGNLINLKTPAQIAIMAEGGKKLRSICERTVAQVKVGTKLSEIEKTVWQDIIAAEGKPAFARVPGYHWATCINVNEGIVHGIPKDYALAIGDVISLDMGMIYRGWHSDMSTTWQVPLGHFEKVHLKNGEIVSAEAVERFLKIGKKALAGAIATAQAGKRIGDISWAIQEVVEGAGYSCVRSLTGHGIGRQLHETPPIPCFLSGTVAETPLLKTGMTLAIEVIYAMGGFETETDEDGWTIRTKDGKLAAVFEKTIAITDDGPFVCT